MKHAVRALVLAIVASISAPVAFAGDQKAAAPRPLADNENPALIGKRNINKRQIDFYSLEKEAALGAKLAADVAQQAKFVDDPIIVEYEDAAKAFEEFEKVLRGATGAGSPSQACIWMRGEFGPRFPDEPDRIKVVSVAATIAAAPATAGPSELIGRTKAG